MSEFWQTVLMKVLDVLIPLLVPALLAFVGAYVAKVWKMFKDSKPDIAYAIENAAEFAVKAAEQMGLTEQLTDWADSKLDYAIDMAERYLAEQGFNNIDLDVIRAAIERAVIEYFPKKQIESGE